jgi:hypothetical protein
MARPHEGLETVSQTHDLPGIAKLLHGADESETESEDEAEAPRSLHRGLPITAMLALRHDAYYPAGALPGAWRPSAYAPGAARIGAHSDSAS